MLAFIRPGPARVVRLCIACALFWTARPPGIAAESGSDAPAAATFAPPAILRDPEPVLIGARAGIARIAAEGEELTFQWYRGESGDDSSPITGATGALLVLPPMDAGGSVWVRVANGAGALNSAALTLDIPTLRPLALRGMGQGELGQLGLGRTGRNYLPELIDGDVLSASAGGSFSLFIKADGSLRGMGDDMDAQLGFSTPLHFVFEPVPVAGDVVAVAAGWRHALFLKRDGSLWSTGNNYHGQRGHPDAGAEPAMIASGVARIAAGRDHGFFIKRDGSLWGMGRNREGQLGLGGNTDQSTPAQIASEVIAVAAGVGHSIYIDAHGRSWVMGSNSVGQLGEEENTARPLPIPSLEGVTEVAAGPNHTFWRKSDGTLWAAGDNTLEQLGLTAGTNPQRTPVQVASEVASVAGSRGVTAGFSFFIKTDASLWSMGNGDEGQLGISFPRPVGDTAPYWVAEGVRSVSAGSNHSLFLQIPPPRFLAVATAPATPSGQSATLTASAEGEGDISYDWYEGAPGDTTLLVGTTTEGRFTTPPIPADTTYWVRARTRYGYADSGAITVTAATPPELSNLPPADIGVIRGQSTFLEASARGGALSFQWYQGESGDTSQPVPGATSSRLDIPTLSDDAFYWVRVSNVAGSIDSPTSRLTVLRGARLLTMGDPLRGRLGTGWTTPPATKIGEGWRQVIASPAGHSLWLKADGSLWGLGANDQGQLGLPPTYFENRLPLFQITSDVTAVAVGTSHSLFLKTDGTLWAMGANGAGQLGIAASDPVGAAIQVDSDVVACAAADAHSLWIKADGGLWVCGSNSHGQLGTGDSTTPTAPLRVLENVRSIATGSGHSLALKTDGTLWGCGDNAHGQLGLGDSTARLEFTLLATEVADVAAGNSHTWILENDGTLLTAGRGTEGQLADGGTESRSTFASVAEGVRAIGTGGGVGFFITETGVVMGAGENQFGQIGLGHQEPVTGPTPISGLPAITAISSSGTHSFFVGESGAVFAAGIDDAGRLADGTNIAFVTPVSVADDVTAVSTSEENTLFVRADGSLWGTGDNREGQLGPTGATAHASPVHLADDVVEAIATPRHTYFIKTDRSLWVLGRPLTLSGISNNPALLATDVRQMCATGDALFFVRNDDSLWGAGWQIALFELADSRISLKIGMIQGVPGSIGPGISSRGLFLGVR